MRILGIDPGYAIVGYGVLDYEKNKFHTVAYGAITTEAHTDFIFAIGAEELGLIFSLMVLVVFTAIFICGIRIALRAPDRLGRMLAYGLSFLMFFQVLFNIGVGLVLSALFVFFRDIQYLWSVFTMLLMYCSAIFYSVESFSEPVQRLFLVNPVYLFIKYFRCIVIDGSIPSLQYHLLMLADVLIVCGLGAWMYKKYNTKFLYYV